MKKTIFLLLIFAAGCGGPIHATVYGKSGAQYVAPDLCAALLQCQKAGESACMYPNEDEIDAAGNKFSGAYCKVIQSK